MWLRNLAIKCGYIAWQPKSIISSFIRTRIDSESSSSTTQTADDDDVSLPVRSPASNPSWVLLNRVGARLDDFPSDGTMSAMSRTSKGKEISISFDLVEPPGISVLTVGKSPGNVVAAHHDVVLLAVTIPFKTSVDLFVYQASCDDPSRRRRPPSLLQLPSAGGPRIEPRNTMYPQEIGIMSCASNDDVVDDFVHYGRQRLCLAPGYLPSAIHRALGKGHLCLAQGPRQTNFPLCRARCWRRSAKNFF